jgi:OmcA/MtrC family decaheme c-type cytochrome
MSMNSKIRIPLAQRFLLAGLGALALGLAGCTGDNGHVDSAPPPDPDPPPGPGTGAPIPITTAQTIVASITKVTIPADGKPVVEIYLHDERNYPLTGLPAGNIYFVLSRLEPEVNGKSSTWHAITRRNEPCAGLPPPVPPNSPTPPDYVTCTAGTSVNQGTTEAAVVGVWTDAGNGVYTYKFQQSVLGIADIPYDSSLTHRVGFEIRINSSGGTSEPYIPANNALYDLVPAMNVPTAITASGRTIVAQSDCDACHQKLEAHGDGRHEVNYCVMCHESYSYDAQTGNAIDFRVMVHKIHMGRDLPSFVATGWPYGIYGFYNFFSDYSGVKYPQNIRNCETCHHENNVDAPQGNAWRTAVNTNTCGSCHDDVNFATGEGHGNGGAATDEQCWTCHGPNSNLASVRTDLAHVIHEQVAAKKFKYEVLNVSNTAPGQQATVTIRVVDPTNGNAPYDIKAPGGPFQNPAGSLTVDVAFSTRPDFTNTGSGSATATTGTPAQPIRIDFKANGVADPAYPGGFTATAATAIPAAATGSGTAFLEGHPGVDVDGNGTPDPVPVRAAQMAFAITDAAPVAYRPIVDIARCDSCHKQLALHGNNRVDNVELCAACHNPNATDINRRVAGSSCEAVTGTLNDQAIDLKYMIHAIHAGPVGAYKVCGFGNTGFDFSDVDYPGKLGNCEGCHLPGTYDPPGVSAAFATTFDAGPDRATPLGDTATTPSTSACSACHNDASAVQHMQFNNGSFNAIKDASSETPGVPPETCGACHGAGKPVDVKVVHNIG